jgi:type I restriction enzyme R subunit
VGGLEPHGGRRAGGERPGQHPDNARLTFDHVANDKIQELIDTNFKFYKQITDDPEFARVFLDWMFERYRSRAGA